MSDSEGAVDTAKRGRGRAKKASEPRSDGKDSGTDEPQAKRGRGKPKDSSKVTTKKAKKKGNRDAEAIHRAAEEGNLEMVRHLIKDGVSVDSRNNKGRTPLQTAAAYCQYDVAKFLISCNSELDLKDHEDHFTLLHFATVNGWADIAQTIIEKSSESDIVNAATRNGSTPLMLASNYESWFTYPHASGDRTERAVMYENIAALLLRSGADINRRDIWGLTALYYAVCSDLAGIVRLLLEVEGLDLDLQNSFGNTPLHFACSWQWRQEVFIKLLLVAGADANLKNSEGKTPFSLYLKACTFYEPTSEIILEVINLFVQHGACFQDSDYEIKSERSFFRENVFNNVELCAKLIINKFNCQTLPALYSSYYYSSMLPAMDNFLLNISQEEEVKNLVRDDIQRNTFCNVVRVRPPALSALCIQCLAAFIASR